MKYKKNLFLILVLILLSGCSKEYNLTITDDKFVEEVNIKVIDNEQNKKMLDNEYYPLHANTKVVYEKKIESDNGYLNLNLKYSYTSGEFANANSINQCFKEKKVVLDKDYYYLELKQMTNCITAFDFDINIITNNKVISNNADEVNNNKYTWHMSKDNKENFKLKIKIAKGIYNKTITSEKIVFYIIVSVSVIALIIFGFITGKTIKNKNKV